MTTMSVRWAVSDGATVARRDLIHWVRNPSKIVFSLLFAVMMVLMFGYLIGGALRVPGGGDYREFMLPGMFAMTMLFGVGETVVAVSSDVARGVTDRFRALPMSPSAVLVGRCVADLCNSVVVLAALLGCGLLVGWQPHLGAANTLAGLGLLLLLRLALTWAGIYLGLVLRGDAAVPAIQTLEFPIGFLSTAFVAASTMPGWLGTIAEWNPLSSTVTATRELFGNPGVTGGSWISEHASVFAVLWPLALLAVFFPLSVRAYRRLGH